MPSFTRNHTMLVQQLRDLEARIIALLDQGVSGWTILRLVVNAHRRHAASR